MTINGTNASETLYSKGGETVYGGSGDDLIYSNA